MHGIVSLLDDDHRTLVEEIWAGLDQELGLRGVYTTPYPHFSYHVAEHYDLEALQAILQQFAANIAPFYALTTGLGIFTGGLHPVVYVNVARSPQLSALNAALWSLVNDAGAGIVDYYHPEQWVPHITLGHGDITGDNLSAVIHALRRWDYSWKIPIDNVALLFNPGDARQDTLQFRFPLGAPPTR